MRSGNERNLWDMFFAQPRVPHPPVVHTFLGLHFTNNVDPATLVTLVLAIVAIVGLIFTACSLKKTQTQIELGQAQLRQTQEEISLSRKEVEQAHRPVVVPVLIAREPRDRSVTSSGQVPPPAYRPEAGDGVLRFPAQNIGSGPALRVEATIRQLEIGAPGGPQTPGTAAGIGVTEIVPLEVKFPRLGEVPDFELTITYDDVAGTGLLTAGRWNVDEGRYTDLTFNTQAEGAYGLKQDSELVKGVPPVS